ncbi:NAD-dependent epimerase/dehydratase family protein [candidate division KSB1 bacterium]|nr:NAD-dependent epimerase/dehydratase family protein [candidate division KSB1 bacterium]
MKILIIGGTRFLGKYLTEALVKSNQEVTLLNRGTARNTFPYFEDVEWLVCDRHNTEKFKSILKNRTFDIVIDLCAYLPEEVELVVEVFRDRIAKYIFCSTMAVAQIQEFDERLKLPVRNLRLFPVGLPNSYAQNKSLIEEFLVEQFDKNGFPFVSLRPTEINGPGEVREWYYIERFKNGRTKLIIPGHGQNLVQPIYVDDVIQAFLLTIVKDNTIGECYNLAGDEVISLNDYIRIIAEQTETKVNIINIPYDIFKTLVNTKYYFPYCNKYSFIVDLTKIKNELGFQPEVSIKDGIQKTLATWRESYTRRMSPYNLSGTYEFLSYDLEDLFISVWEKVIEKSKDQLRQELLEKGMLI